ncbi:helix-turn-helix domain-containing protein [Chitinophaga sp. S165]|uniref:helix-turn-helix domain-containing protein n=1 Tax=Chitinophaga sp. S165 TaxID=2135462 RepID=UPI000D87B902|nr:AraC family transcriptional regulator [Chitinophaga sp. S165]PWV49786.1 AraC-like DNA-binding protein [Chitinophaga sp. S165]
MYLFSAGSIEFFREIYSPSDVPKRFCGTIMQHSAKVVHGDAQKIIFLQRLAAGLFEVFEHQVICETTEKEILPTPLKPSLHLHISLDNNDVDAYVNGTDSVELKRDEVNLFYLEEINVAIIPKGKHCFFHISFSNDTLFRILKQPAFESEFDRIRKSVRNAEKNMGGMINAPGQVPLDAYYMMLVQQIRHCRFNEIASIYYREKKCMMMLEHFIRQMLPRKENTIRLTSSKVIILDLVKEYIKGHIHQSLTTKKLCQQFNITRNFLEKGFYQLNRISVNQFIHYYRLEYATKLLSIEDMPLNNIPRLTGYRNYRSFAAAFRRYFNCDPELFRHP